MPEVLTIIVIIASLIALYIAFKILKSVIKLFFVVSLILTIVLGVFAFFLIQDALELKDRFPHEEKVLLISTEEGITRGAIIGDFNNLSQVHIIEEQALDRIETNIENDNYDEVLLNNYSIIILNVNNSNTQLEDLIDSPTSLISAYKNEEIIIYPETLTFKTIKYFPIGDNDENNN